MTQATQSFNNIAPLANVVRLQTLAVRLQNRAHGLPGIGCLFSPAGYGKSTAGIFVTNSIGACHIQALPFGGTKGLLTMIVSELGERPARTVSDLFMQAADKLQRTGKILIIDEADQILTDRTIEMLRLLHDTTEAPLILMGEELLPAAAYPSVAYAEVTLETVAGIGTVLQKGAGATNRNISERTHRPFVVGQKMRFRMKTRLTTNPATGSHSTRLYIAVTVTCPPETPSL